MWLMSPGTALWLVGAFVGAVLLLAFTGLPTLVSVVVGIVAGGTLAAYGFGDLADHMDRWLRTPKPPRR